MPVITAATAQPGGDVGKFGQHFHQRFDLGQAGNGFTGEEIGAAVGQGR